MDKLKTVQAVQLNLFLPRPTLPRWTQLTPEVQEAVREFVIQMLCEHLADQLSDSLEEEFDHE